MQAAAVQVPIGVEDQEDVVDLVRWKAVYNRGVKGVDIVESGEIPASALELATQKCTELTTRCGDPECDRLSENVFFGDAVRVKNTAVEPLLDGVCAYLASPSERQIVEHGAMQPAGRTTSRASSCSSSTTRCLGGSLKKGQFIFHGCSGKQVKVPKLVRMHSNEMEMRSRRDVDIDSIGPGEICAIFGVECATGDTFTDGTTNYSMVRELSNSNNLHTLELEPFADLDVRTGSRHFEPVGTETPNFSRALNRFQKEDPTFRVHIDHESKENHMPVLPNVQVELQDAYRKSLPHNKK
ncbi:hypothetical protein EDB89DRAFT_2231793 [Lactarius sanguifluus]|nr:hypothetical protein EDB89DRAFT_2231793 [Lactarius sanguifluus]